uniref:Uncharacterized protein n=1 Tax=Anguilla anguilla TaxID=7936 RepID=A0A0E9RGT8_ANGAN
MLSCFVFVLECFFICKSLFILCLPSSPSLYVIVICYNEHFFKGK